MRLRKLIAEYGWRGLLLELWQRVRRRLFEDRVQVWLHNGTVPEIPRFVPLEFAHYTSLGEIPDDVLGQLLAPEAELQRAELEDEFARHGELWVATSEGAVAGYIWARQGVHVKRYFVQISQADYVSYRGFTMPAFRWMGIAPALWARQAADVLAPDRRLWANCMIWNKPSAGTLRRAGYKLIAVVPRRAHKRGPVPSPVLATVGAESRPAAPRSDSAHFSASGASEPA